MTDETKETTPAKPKIVCLCGSTRFYDTFQSANYWETMAGRIVLTVGFYPHARNTDKHGEEHGCTPEQKKELDQLHFRKIDIADEIFVLNVDGYVGHSTRNEIAYARSKNKSIRWFELPECYKCKHSGMDMDMNPYCAHPKTLVSMPYGSTLCRPSPSRDHCGPNMDSWEPRDEQVSSGE